MGRYRQDKTAVKRVLKLFREKNGLSVMTFWNKQECPCNSLYKSKWAFFNIKRELVKLPKIEKQEGGKTQ